MDPKKWQKAWKQAGIFEPEIDTGKKKFFLTVPYPYTSGPLHIGHGRTYVTADVLARYKRHRGYNVLWPMGFHISGSPIQSIADRIARGDKETIELYKDYVRIFVKDEKKVEETVKGFSDPWKVAEFFATHIQEDFERIGLSIDWRRKFHTGEEHYQRFVRWQFRKLKEAGLITKGTHPLLFAPAEDQAVGEDDIKDGDTDPVKVVEFVAVKFKFEDGFIVAATLRPETLFGVTNLWVNEDANYVKAKVDGETLFVSREALEKLKYQNHEVEVIAELPGKYFLGKNAIAPLVDKEVPILPAKFVDPDNATGFVYSVPGHAPYDFVALKEAKVNIEPIRIIESKMKVEEVIKEMNIKDQTDKKLEEATEIVYKDEFYFGKLNEKCGKFAGMSVKEAKEKVKEELISKGAAFIFYETSRKAVTRAGNKVIVAVLPDQWFLDYSSEELKRKAHAHVDSMKIIPEKYRKLFHDTIDWLQKRPCARKRGLGTRLPFDEEWVIESLSDSTIYMAYYTISHIAKDIEMNDEIFDYVFLGKGDPAALSEKYGIDQEKIERMRREFVYWYPNDQRHTAPAHITNHLTFSILHHIVIFPKEYWPPCYSFNSLVIREGTKMSKSKGNVIPLAEVAEYPDLFRLYVLANADLDGVVDWRESDLRALRNKLESFRKLIQEVIKSEPKKVDWVEDVFRKKLALATEHMERMEFRDALIELFFNMLNDAKLLVEVFGYGVLKPIVKDWIISLAPFIPHTCEEYWHMMENTFVSTQEWPSCEFDVDKAWSLEFIRKFEEDLQEVLKLVGKKGKIYVYTADERKWELLKMMQESLELKDALKKVKSKEEAKMVQKLWPVRNEIRKVNEAQLIEQFAGYFKKYGEIIINSEYDPLNKRKHALPGKPAIYVE